jgi:hypothetical protein
MSAIPILKSDNPHCAEFLQAAQEMGSCADALAQPLKRIIAVGARYDRDKGFLGRDYQWVKQVFEHCKEKSLTIARDFEIAIVNYEDSHDFLDPGLKIFPDANTADIVISCFIPSHNNPNSTDPFHRTSPRMQDKDAWRKAATNVGARLVAAWRDGRKSSYEICASHFEGPNYVKCPTREIRGGLYFMDVLASKKWPEGLVRLGIGTA